MDMSEDIGQLAGALAKAQAIIEGAAKDRNNPAFKSKYADLSSVWDAWQAVGPANDLAVSQLPGAMLDGKVTMTTILMHKSGQWLSNTLAIPVTKQDAQGYGSALTYARRYALAALAGIAPEDDDGNAAVGTPEPKQAREKLEGPHATKSALKEAIRAFAFALAETNDSDTLEGLIDDAKEMLAQVRRYIPEWWDGGEGIERTLPETIANHRARVKQREVDGVPSDPGDNEPPETVKVLLMALEGCQTTAAVKDWHEANKPLIDSLPEHRDALAEAYKARARVVRSQPIAA